MADARGIRAGAAFVELFADDAALQKGLAAAEKSVKQFGVSVGKVGAAIGALGAAITVPMIAAVNAFAEGGSQLAHMAERTGMSVEALSTLGYAARQSGTDLESVEVAVKRLQKAMTAGSLENQQAAQTFANLGINIQQLMKLKPDDQFTVVAKRLAEVQNPAARAGAAMMLFGRSGTALLPLIEHLGALSKEAKDFGLVTSTEAAQGALKLEHSLKLLDAITHKIFTTIGSALAPMFENWNNQLARVEKAVLDLVKANKPLIISIAQVGFALVATGTAVVTLGTVIWGLGQTIAAVSTVIGVIYGALLLLTTPLGLIAVGFIATTTAMGKWTDAGKLAMDFIKNEFSGVLKDFQDIFKGMSDALKAGDIQLAAQILWAGLKLEFIKGSQGLAAVWGSLKETLSLEALMPNTDLASGFTDLWAAIQTGAVKAAFAISAVMGNAWINIKIGFMSLTNFMQDTWDALISYLPKPLTSFAGFMFDRFNEIKGLITGTFLDSKKYGEELAAASKAFQEVVSPEAAAQRKAGRGEEQNKLIKERDRGDAERNKGKAEVLARIEAERAAAQKVLSDDMEAAAKEKRQADQAKADAARKELADAQAALDRLKGKAAEKAAEPEAFGEGGQGPSRGERAAMTPEGLDKGLKEAVAKVDVVGTFSAATAAGAGVGPSIEKEHLNESKKQTKELEHIKKNTAKQAVFET
jgi:hypothetical protein